MEKITDLIKESFNLCKESKQLIQEAKTTILENDFEERRYYKQKFV